ncbi:electron transfer flavoprotein subunit alpha/FixB family protein [Sedimentibacter sp.]|uniref:electron transfer flavoprotein subunit alpha/FixB family protein n=1 Tax=Sedimentibacter sp. TaxID=1960295 RepID=UPI000EC2E937|nr:electron transfer flavoprotein subunit alpha/FixB family protein [Sedimentibacter sp.]HCX61812.1 electron transfer flavoprotein subunit alpha/FixB family protein [Clostridiales bacterium]
MTEKIYNGILIFAEQKNNAIHRVSYELLGKGKELSGKIGCSLNAVILGPEEINAPELICRGADKVYHIADSTAFNKPDELIYAENIVSLIKSIKPEICLFGATTFGRSLAPRVAASLETGLTADCTDLKTDDDMKLIQIRPAFSENILAHIKSDTYPQMATVRYKEFEEAKRDSDRTGEIIKIQPVKMNNDLIEILEEISNDGINIQDAKVVVAAGVSVKSAEDLSMIKELAVLLGGEVGASRALVETGIISKDHQVGYSGNRVKPAVYIACGISGAPQHLAGMKEAGVIIAINNDPSAPIFNIADYSIIGDMYKIIPEIISAIRNNNLAI